MCIRIRGRAGVGRRHGLTTSIGAWVLWARGQGALPATNARSETSRRANQEQRDLASRRLTVGHHAADCNSLIAVSTPCGSGRIRGQRLLVETEISIPLPTPSHPLIDRLWRRHVVDVPFAETFCTLRGGAFQNDHIALRSVALNGPGSGVRPLARIFQRLGWQVREHSVFADVHLRALCLSQSGLPRIFVSELDPTPFPLETRRRWRR